MIFRFTRSGPKKWPLHLQLKTLRFLHLANLSRTEKSTYVIRNIEISFFTGNSVSKYRLEKKRMRKHLSVPYKI